MNEQEFIVQLTESAKRTERFSSMTDAELAELLICEIWAKMNLFTSESDLISAIVGRLRGDK